MTRGGGGVQTPPKKDDIIYEQPPILGPPYCGIGAAIRIGREMLCLANAGFFLGSFLFGQKVQRGGGQGSGD